MEKRSIIVSKYTQIKYREIIDPSDFSCGGTRTETFLGDTHVSIFIYNESDVVKNNLNAYIKDDTFERYCIYQEISINDKSFMEKLSEALNSYCQKYKYIVLYIDNMNEEEITLINNKYKDKISIEKKPKRKRGWDIKF